MPRITHHEYYPGMSFWQAQRIRDLLFTLRDIDNGENVAVEEIDELAAIFKPMPEHEQSRPIENKEESC